MAVASCRPPHRDPREPSIAATPTVNDRPIGVFDSGLGGLTVLQALADLLPDEDLVYFGDTARYPYGPRPAAQLRDFSHEITEVLLDRGVKMVVVACNSATAAALPDLRARHDVPFVGVVEPGVRAAVKATRTGRVGVIGTEMTARSRVYEVTAQRLRTGLDLHVAACPGFVELVEEGRTTGPRARRVVEGGLRDILATGIDTLVLGCTHYPLLARTISDVAGRDVTLVSSADETAFEVRGILERTGWGRVGGDPAEQRNAAPARRTFLTSGDPARFARLGERFLGWPLRDVQAHGWASVA